MNAPLPVIEHALERLDSWAQIPFDEERTHLREALIKAATKAELMAMWYSANAAGVIEAGTWPTPGVVVQHYGPKLFVRPHGNETNDVCYEVLREYINKSRAALERYEVIALATGGGKVTLSYVSSPARLEADTSPQSLENRYSWLKVVYELVGKGESRKALRVIYSAVEKHFKESDLRSLNEVLAGVELSRLDVKAMTALLRITARAESGLSSWKLLLGRVKDDLNRRQVPDVDGLLVGLEG